MARLPTLLTLVASLVAAAPARADRGEPRVLVEISGPEARRFFDVVDDTLDRHGFDVAAAREGRGDVADQARERGAIAALSIQIIRGTRARAFLAAMDADGEVIGSARFAADSLGALRRRMRRRMWDAVGKDLDDLEGRRSERPGREAADAAPAEDDSVDLAFGDDEVEDIGDDDDDDDDGGDGAPLTADVRRHEQRRDLGGAPRVRLSAGAILLSRTFEYTDDLFEELQGHNVSSRPGVTLDFEWGPTGRRDWTRHLGLAGRYVIVASSDIDAPNGETYTSRTSAFRVGLRWRQLWRRFALAGVLDYAGRSFAFEQGAALRRLDIPDVRYRSLRAGAEARRPVDDAGRWIAGGSVAYRHLLDTGEVVSFFPRSTARGADAALWLDYRRWDRLGLRLALDVERYAFSMNPEPGDEMIAGGALDQYITVLFGLHYDDL